MEDHRDQHALLNDALDAVSKTVERSFHPGDVPRKGLISPACIQRTSRAMDGLSCIVYDSNGYVAGRNVGAWHRLF
jgi:hypothetical protein